MLLSIIIGIEYAFFDELHQLFVAGRAGKFTDVLIDSIGVAIGVCIMMLFYKLKNKKEGTKDRKEVK